MISECPDCGNALRGISCACGYRVPSRPATWQQKDEVLPPREVARQRIADLRKRFFPKTYNEFQDGAD